MQYLKKIRMNTKIHDDQNIKIIDIDITEIASGSSMFSTLPQSSPLDVSPLSGA